MINDDDIEVVVDQTVVTEVVETVVTDALVEVVLQPELLEVTTPVDDAVEIVEVLAEPDVIVELQDTFEVLETAEQGPPGRDSDVYFEKVLGAVRDVLVPVTEHLLPSVHTATLFTPGGDEVSISINVTNGDVSVSSNVNLANHRLVIF